MRDEDKAKEQIINELREATQRVVELEKLEDERKKMEEELRRQKDFAESIVKTVQVIILVLDVDGRIIRFNQHMEKISGYSLKEVQGKDWFTTFLPERDQKRIRELFLKAISNIQTHGNVNVIIAKDGREREIEWYDRILRDADGRVSGLLVIGQDVTEHKKAEEQLREQKLLLEQKNVVLREVIAQIEVDKNRLKEDLAFNIDEMVIPILDKLKAKKTMLKYVNLLKKHLTDLASPFGRKIRERSVKLTSRESEICKMIKANLTSKEISDLLSISSQTIDKHRKNIRKKLAITNKRINLSSYLHKL
ncbi:MAG: PAS domain S-box protein [Candidatus Omnitrophota bacterium]